MKGMSMRKVEREVYLSTGGLIIVMYCCGCSYWDEWS
jgi:hypothetical protein